MKRRILLVLLASLTAVAILSGCSGKTTKQAPSSQTVGITNTSEEVVVSEEDVKFSLQDYIPEVEKGYFQDVVYINTEYEYTEREDFVKEYGDPYKYLHPHAMVNGYLIEIVSRAEQDSHAPVLDFYLGGYEFLAGATDTELVEKLTEYCNGNAIDCTGKDFEEAENEALSKMEKTFIYSYDDYECRHNIEKSQQNYPKAIRVEIIEPRAPKSTKSESMLDTTFLLNESDQLISVEFVYDDLYVRRHDQNYWTDNDIGVMDIFVWDESIGDLVRVKGGTGDYKYGENFAEWYKEYQANHPEGEDPTDYPYDW